MKWYKVEFELGDYKTDPFIGYRGYMEVRWIKDRVREYLTKLQGDYYLKIRNIKIKEI